MIYKSKKFGSWVYKKSNLIIRSINRHLLEKLTKEANKRVVFLGKFNIDILFFDASDHMNTFLDDLASKSL